MCELRHVYRLGLWSSSTDEQLLKNNLCALIYSGKYTRCLRCSLTVRYKKQRNNVIKIKKIIFGMNLAHAHNNNIMVYANEDQFENAVSLFVSAHISLHNLSICSDCLFFTV